MGLTAVLNAAASMYPTRTATVFNGRTQTYAELQDKVAASSPYVTSVGATQVTQYPHNVTETVCSTATGALITSGGGFSNTYLRPRYQNGAVGDYLQRNKGKFPPANMFNTSMRAVPDVSAVGHRYPIIVNGATQITDGTSCSTPVFGGIVAVLNDLRAQKGLPRIGRANPWIYSIYDMKSHANPFRDVTTGNNRCGETKCCDAGFEAQPGYDCATGVGTPNFEQLAAIDAAMLHNRMRK